MNDPQLYILKPDVAVVKRKGSFLLYSAINDRSMKTSAASASLLPLLKEGTNFETLADRLRQDHPNAVDVSAKLKLFLATLANSGFLSGAEGGAGSEERGSPKGKWPLIDLNAAAQAVASAIRILPASLWSVVALAAMLASVAAIIVSPLPSLRYLMEHIDPLGVALFAFVLVPIHEFAHAVACRLVGVRVGKAGILLHGGIIPGPYVDTGQSYLIESPWRRALIPAAGPFVNLLGAGSAAAALGWGDVGAPAVSAFSTVFLLASLFVWFDTNPLVASDGSHVAEALMGDELARRHALSHRQPAIADRIAVRRYRIYISAHLTIGVALLLLWWNL